MKMTMEQAVMELYYWQVRSGEATNFTAKLYELIAKADPLNLALLRKAFPLEVAAFEAWQDSIDPEKFFRSYGFCEKY